MKIMNAILYCIVKEGYMWLMLLFCYNGKYTYV